MGKGALRERHSVVIIEKFRSPSASVIDSRHPATERASVQTACRRSLRDFVCERSGQVAQVVERSPEKAGVGGSTPSLATIIPKNLADCAGRSAEPTDRAWPVAFTEGASYTFLSHDLAKSHATVIVPLDDCVLFVRLSNRPQLSCRLSEVAQTFDAISGVKFLTRGTGLDERWPPRTA